MTLLLGKRYENSVKYIIQRLKHVKSLIPLLVLTNLDNKFECDTCKVIQVSSLYERAGIQAPTTFLNHTRGRRLFQKSERNALYLKFLAWSVTEYEKILFLDADVYIRENIDYVFDFQIRKSLMASPACKQNIFNSGVFLFHPSSTISNLLFSKKSFEKYCENKITDQSVLNSFFKRQWDKFPVHIVDHVHYVKKEREENASIIHYVGEPKPTLTSSSSS